MSLVRFPAIMYYHVIHLYLLSFIVIFNTLLKHNGGVRMVILQLTVYLIMWNSWPAKEIQH